MNQRSFSDLAYDHKKKVTRKERFLNEMDAIIPWDVLLSCIDAVRVNSPLGRPLTSCCAVILCSSVRAQ